jgi:hypothetical protein
METGELPLRTVTHVTFRLTQNQRLQESKPLNRLP